MEKSLQTAKSDLIAEIDRRVEDKILEQSNADLLKKLIINAETLTEAISIAELGTTYKRTGFHFDKRLEKLSNTIKFFRKNNELSFSDGTDDIPNKLIIGDNYDALLNLLIEYKGKIDFIYIDPPYGKDSMGEFAKTNYENSITRDNLLSMLYPRLVLARQLLNSAGAIFCSIDNRNQAYVKCLFDEIFGEKNFLGAFIWRKKSGGGQTDEFFVTEHEYILVYRKTTDFKWINFVEDVDETAFKYDDHDGKGSYSITKLEKWGSSAHKEDRPTMYFPITDPNGQEFYPIAPDGLPGRWRVGKARMDKLVTNNEIYWVKDAITGKWTPYEKQYSATAKGKLEKSRSILYDLAETGTATKLLTSIFNKKDVFDNPKPVELIKFFLKHTESDIVLDFFAGSGTTGQAVMELNIEDDENRKFILCTNNEITEKNPNGIAIDVTTKRLKRTMTGSCYDGTSNFKWLETHKPLGGSLDVYDIASVANFEKTSGKTPFDAIDETLYGRQQFTTIREKIEWVCGNFEGTQKIIENDEDWLKRMEENN